MMKPIIACLALAALPAAALSQAQPAAAEWTVSAGQQGCIAHTTLPQGTVVSVLAGIGQERLLFLIQNKNWSSLEDGSSHELAVQLDGRSRFQFQAVAKTELDSDGPGLLFTVAPGDQEGAKFIAEFASASGMNVGEGGRTVADLSLEGGGSAMTGLAQCMARMWGAGKSGGETGPVPDGKAIAL